MPTHQTQAVASRALSSSLTDQQQPTNVEPSTSTTMSSSGRRNRAASFTTSGSERISLPYLPPFAKSATVSTTSSASTSASLSSAPKTRTSRASAEVGLGEFSKPRVHERSRRDRTGSGASGAGEFRYYGRHGNQWLFNDFSVTDSVRKGWGRVFGKEKEQDWFEKRN